MAFFLALLSFSLSLLSGIFTFACSSPNPTASGRLADGATSSSMAITRVLLLCPFIVVAPRGPLPLRRAEAAAKRVNQRSNIALLFLLIIIIIGFVSVSASAACSQCFESALPSNSTFVFYEKLRPKEPIKHQRKQENGGLPPLHDWPLTCSTDIRNC